MARLVVTHSTFIPGLLKSLRRLAESSSIRTIIPGRLYKTSSNCKTGLELRLTTISGANTDSGNEDVGACLKDTMTATGSLTQKVLARKNSMVQEVFLVVEANSFVSAQLKGVKPSQLNEPYENIGNKRPYKNARSQWPDEEVGGSIENNAEIVKVDKIQKLLKLHLEDVLKGDDCRIVGNGSTKR